MIPNIPDIFRQVAATSSTKEKVNILKSNKSTTTSTILNLAYNPHITFGVANVDPEGLTFNENRTIDERWFDSLLILLERLSAREYTGNRARDMIVSQMESGPRAWAEMLANILKKDLRMGASVKLINKAYPGLLPEDFCMLAEPFDEKKLTFPRLSDFKLNGFRAVARMDGIYSRKALLKTNYPHIEAQLKVLRKFLNYEYDGEIMDKHFQDLMKTVNRKVDGVAMASNTTYHIFDIYEGKGILLERVKILEKAREIIKREGLKNLYIVDRRMVHNMEEVDAMYEEAMELCLEGLVLKDPNSLYVCKRTTDWMKKKPEESVDVPIVGVTEGTKGTKYEGMLGAFICVMPSGQTFKVGGGFKDWQRKEYWDNKDKIIGKEIAEVEFFEYTRDGIPFQGRFKTFRDDK